MRTAAGVPTHPRAFQMWSEDKRLRCGNLSVLPPLAEQRLHPFSHQLVEERARKCVSFTFQQSRVSFFLLKFTCRLELPVSVKFRGGAQRVRPGCHGAQPLKGFETVQMTRREQEVQQ